MLRSIALAALLLQCHYTIASQRQDTIRPSEQTILRPVKYHFRDANKEDIHDIVTVILDAFSPGASFRYTTPGYEQYKDQIKYCVEQDITRQWDHINTNSTSAKVVAVPVSDGADGRNERVVAISIWKQMDHNDTAMSTALQSFIQRLQYGLLSRNSVPDDTININSRYNCSARLGTNQARAADLSRQLAAAQTQYLTNVYPKQLYLSALATHPDWDGHSFAAQSLHWGVQTAAKLEEPVTLIATPVGFPLYDSVGFRSLKNVSIETLDGWEGEKLWFEVMDYQ